MISVFNDEYLFTQLLPHISITEIENIYLCDSTLRSTLRSTNVISILAKLHNINKSLRSFYDFLVEYDHRYRRENSFENDLDYHLLWAIKDNDIETIKSVLESYTYNLERYSDFGFYNLFFEAGCKNNEQILDLLTRKGLRDFRTRNKIMYISGMAYAGNEIKDEMMNDITNKESRLILFEAIRGNNTLFIENLKSKCDLDEYKHAMIYGATASNNLKLLTVLLKNTIGDNKWISKKIPIIEYGSCLGIFGKDTFSVINELITIALYYNSDKVLDFLCEDYQLSECVKDAPYYEWDVRIYRWVIFYTTFDDKTNKYILMNALCGNNLPLAKELERYINPNKLPKYFDEMLDNNAYKVVKWILHTFNYDKELIKNQLQIVEYTNYAVKITYNYIITS